MKWNISNTNRGLYELEVFDQPSYCCALRMAPKELEQCLKEGWWLVLNIAVWSGPDREAIAIALKVAERYHGKLKLGIRLFDSHSEFKSWHPMIQAKGGSPVWVCFRDGCFLREMMGLYNQRQLAGILRSVFGD